MAFSLPDNYQKLTTIDISKQALTEVPVELKNCTRLEELNLYDNDIKELPEWLKDLPNLKSLKLGSSPHPIPDWLGEMQQLERLDIGYTPMFAIPDCIFKLQQLKELRLYDCQLTTIDKRINVFQQLKRLSLSYNKLTELPEEIGQLISLESLRVSLNQLKELPQWIGQLKKLVYLNIEYNQIDQILPAVLAEMDLFSLSFYGNPNVLLPSSILLNKRFNTGLLNVHNNAQLKALVTLKEVIGLEQLMHFIPTIKYQDKVYFGYLPDVQVFVKLGKKLVAFFQALFAQKVSVEKIEQLFFLLIEHPATQHFTRRQLFDLFDIAIPATRNTIIKLLPQTVPTLSDAPLKTGVSVCIKGKTLQDKSTLQAKMEEVGVQHSTRVNRATTHILLAKGATLGTKEKKSQFVFVNEQAVQDFYEGKTNPYLLQKSEEADYSIEQIRTLLLTKEAENINLGLQMLEGMGVPDELMPYVISIYKWQGETMENRQKAKKLALLYGAESVKKGVKSRKHLLLNDYFSDNRKPAIKLIKAFAAQTGLAAFPFFEYFYRKIGEFKGYFLDTEEVGEDIVKQTLEEMREGNTLTIDGDYSLERFPMQAYQMTDITHLKIEKCFFKELPTGIYQLQQLQSVYIDRNKHLRKLPDDLFDLPNLEELKLNSCPISTIPNAIQNAKRLKKLELSFLKTSKLPAKLEGLTALEILNINYCRKLKKLPASISQLQNLVELKLYACELLTAFPTFVYDLKQLKKLDLHDNGFDTFPQGVSQLKNLEELRVYDMPIQELPDDLQELTQIKVLDFQGLEIKQLPANLSAFTALKTLYIDECKGLESLPPNLDQLANLSFINAKDILPCLQEELKELLPNCRIYT